MKGSEFIRKVKAIADERDIDVTYVPERGTGSHGTLYVGDKFTVVPNPKGELKKGTVYGMLK